MTFFLSSKAYHCSAINFLLRIEHAILCEIKLKTMQISCVPKVAQPCKFKHQAYMAALVELFFLFVLRWRIGVATLGALLLAIVAVNSFAAVTGEYGIVLVLLGFGIGVFWDASAGRRKIKR